MSIRKVTTEDIGPLAELFDAYRVFYGKTSDLQAASVFLEDRISGVEAHVYADFNKEEKMTGFILLYPLYSSTRMKKLWLLNDLYVHPDFRGNGISKKLLDRAKTLCKQSKACALMLETDKTNTIGNTLYLAEDFHLDTEHHYYTWENSSL